MNGAEFLAMEEAQRNERAGDVYKKVAASDIQLAAICLWATKKMFLRFYRMTLNAHNKKTPEQKEPEYSLKQLDKLNVYK